MTGRIAGGLTVTPKRVHAPAASRGIAGMRPIFEMR